MSITTAMCTSYKQELFEAMHNHKVAGGDQFYMALFLSAAVLNAGTTVYTGANETSGAGYNAGGVLLTNVDPSSSGTGAFTQFGDVEWPGSSITARGCQIYNNTQANRSVSVHDFGQDYTSLNAAFRVWMPTNDVNSALLRIV